jgi:hypothetical protein
MRFRVIVHQESQICTIVEAPKGSSKAFLRECVLEKADCGEESFECVYGDTDFYEIKGDDDDKNHGCFLHDNHPSV